MEVKYAKLIWDQFNIINFLYGILSNQAILRLLKITILKMVIIILTYQIIGCLLWTITLAMSFKFIWLHIQLKFCKINHFRFLIFLLKLFKSMCILWVELILQCVQSFIFVSLNGVQFLILMFRGNSLLLFMQVPSSMFLEELMTNRLRG